MVFNKYNEAVNWFRQYSTIDESLMKDGFYANSIKSTSMSKNPNLKFGDWFLFQHIKGETISRPILAIFVGFNIWDQALVIQFIESPRAYRNFHHYISNPDINYEMCLAERVVETEQIQFWTDDIKIIGYWKHKPNFKEIKKSLVDDIPTIEYRDMLINRLI